MIGFFSSVATNSFSSLSSENVQPVCVDASCRVQQGNHTMPASRAFHGGLAPKQANTEGHFGADVRQEPGRTISGTAAGRW